MAITLPVVIVKKERKTRGNQCPLLCPAATGEAIISPVEMGASPERPAGDSRHLLTKINHFLTKIDTGKTTRDYHEKETVFSQGGAADAVFYVQSGSVQLTVVSRSGKEAVAAILPEDSFFGEGCLAGQPVHMSTARTVERSTIIRIEKRVMLRLLHQYPEVAESLLAYMISRNIRIEADLVDRFFNSSEKRLARLLLLMANFGQQSQPTLIIAKMSQETIAEMIGTTRSRVSYFMNRFRELGFIDYGGDGIHVHRSLVSVLLHDS